MPIKGLSEQRRIPRVGKIHLGIKKKKGNVEYPSATDYFVVPEEVVKVYGEEPKELPIMIPVEDEEYWASQYYRCYSRSRGLVCKGDGESSRMMVDIKTGAMANRDSKEVVWKETKCEGRECPYYKEKQCREVMNLQFLLPDVPGLGVWQIDTSSINSIRNINSATELIRGICGRIRMLPLLLTLEKQEVVNPDDGKKKHVCVLNLRHSRSLYNLLLDSAKPVQELLAPPPAEDEAPLDEIESEPEPEATKSKSSPVKKQSNGDVSKEDTEQAEKDVEKMWPKDPVHAKEAAVKVVEEPIDKNWLKESITKLKWTEKTAATYLTGKYKVEGGLLKDVLPRLTKEQQAEFVKEISDRLLMT